MIEPPIKVSPDFNLGLGILVSLTAVYDLSLISSHLLQGESLISKTNIGLMLSFLSLLLVAIGQFWERKKKLDRNLD